jgi:hypothetical protein
VVWLRKGKRGGGLSGGWRGFAIDNEICAGDSVCFEVAAPAGGKKQGERDRGFRGLT